MVHADHKLVSGGFKIYIRLTQTICSLRAGIYPKRRMLPALPTPQIHLQDRIAKAGNIRSSGCHRFCFEGSPSGKKSRPRVSGGNVPTLKLFNPPRIRETPVVTLPCLGPPPMLNKSDEFISSSSLCRCQSGGGLGQNAKSLAEAARPAPR